MVSGWTITLTCSNIAAPIRQVDHFFLTLVKLPN